MTIHRRRRRRGKPRDLLKDRLIQTRVPEGLESALKEEARKRRLSVSHLIRNVLEDTFHLVDDVVAEVDHLVKDSVDLAVQVGRDAGRIAEAAKRGSREAREGREAWQKREASAATPSEADATLAHVLAWNAVVMNQEGRCVRCRRALARGEAAHLGLSATPAAAPVWLCPSCLSKISA